MSYGNVIAHDQCPTKLNMSVSLVHFRLIYMTFNINILKYNIYSSNNNLINLQKSLKQAMEAD